MTAEKKSPILVEPKFGYADRNGLPHKPTSKETIKEWLFVMNCVSNPGHSLTAINFACQLATSIPFFVFLGRYASMPSLLFLLCAVLCLGTVYNTVWYHRYCSDMAFQFTRPLYAKIILWTNPLAFIFREEIYALPHQIHHQRTEQAGDPYGPHLGYFANFLSPELTQRINPNITREEFESRKKSLLHIGLRSHSYERFRTTGSIESLCYYAARAIFSQVIWIAATYAMGGVAFVAAYYSAIFITTVLIRDFNWRGHGGNLPGLVKRRGWEFDKNTRSLNQYFYGFIASEWHDNHHHYRTSARNGFLPGQIDAAFILVKYLHRIGIVKSYIDAQDLFYRQCVSSRGN